MNNSKLFKSLVDGGKVFKVQKPVYELKETFMTLTVGVDCSVEQHANKETGETFNVLNFEFEGDKVSVPFKYGTLLSKEQYTVGQFEAIRDFNELGVSVKAGDTKVCAY